MDLLYIILYLLGFLCFAAGAFRETAIARVNLIALGLAFWILVPLIVAVKAY